MNNPSTVVIVPVAMVQTIPKRGTMPMTMEITSIIGSNSPPYYYYCPDGFQSYVQGKDEMWADGSLGPISAHCALNVASTVLLSLATRVTFCSCVPIFSWTKANV